MPWVGKPETITGKTDPTDQDWINCWHEFVVNNASTSNPVVLSPEFLRPGSPASHLQALEEAYTIATHN